MSISETFTNLGIVLLGAPLFCGWIGLGAFVGNCIGKVFKAEDQGGANIGAVFGGCAAIFIFFVALSIIDGGAGGSGEPFYRASGGRGID